MYTEATEAEARRDAHDFVVGHIAKAVEGEIYSAIVALETDLKWMRNAAQEALDALKAVVDERHVAGNEGLSKADRSALGNATFNMRVAVQQAKGVGHGAGIIDAHLQTLRFIK